MNYTNLDQKFVFTFILGQLLNNKQIIPRRLTQQGVKLLELKTRENYNLYVFLRSFELQKSLRKTLILSLPNPYKTFSKCSRIRRE